jgi:hypothetical protein
VLLQLVESAVNRVFGGHVRDTTNRGLAATRLKKPQWNASGFEPKSGPPTLTSVTSIRQAAT